MTGDNSFYFAKKKQKTLHMHAIHRPTPGRLLQETNFRVNNDSMQVSMHRHVAAVVDKRILSPAENWQKTRAHNTHRNICIYTALNNIAGADYIDFMKQGPTRRNKKKKSSRYKKSLQSL